MSTYLLIEIRVLDGEIFAEYVRQFPVTIEKFGGRLLVRGSSVVPLAGDWSPERLTMVEFPSLDHLRKWNSSEDYRKIVPLRERSAHIRAIAVEGPPG